MSGERGGVCKACGEDVLVVPIQIGNNVRGIAVDYDIGEGYWRGGPGEPWMAYRVHRRHSETCEMSATSSAGSVEVEDEEVPEEDTEQARSVPEGTVHTVYGGAVKERDLEEEA